MCGGEEPDPEIIREVGSSKEDDIAKEPLLAQTPSAEDQLNVINTSTRERDVVEHKEPESPLPESPSAEQFVETEKEPNTAGIQWVSNNEYSEPQSAEPQSTDPLSTEPQSTDDLAPHLEDIRSESRHSAQATTLTHSHELQEETNIIIAITSPHRPHKGMLFETQTIQLTEDLDRDHLFSSYGSDQSDDDLEDGDQGYQRRTHSALQSMHSYPTRRFTFPTVMAKHILNNSTFVDLRRKFEDQIVENIDDVDSIHFNEKHKSWIIQGPDAQKLEQHRDLWNIVIWRVKIIPAFAKFANKQELFMQIFGDEEEPDDIEWIWSVLSKRNFMSIFEKKEAQRIFTEIDLIDDSGYTHLIDADTFPASSEEYRSLVRSLKNIELLQKSEIVLCGTQKSVRTLLRSIRQKEVLHDSTNADALALTWQISETRHVDASKIECHECVICSQFGSRISKRKLEMLLRNDGRFNKYLFVELQEDKEPKDPSTIPLTPPTPLGTPTVLTLTPTAVRKKKFKFARVVFGDSESLNAFMEAVNSEDGLYMGRGSSRIEIVQQSEIQRTMDRRQRLMIDDLIFIV